MIVETVLPFDGFSGHVVVRALKEAGGGCIGRVMLVLYGGRNSLMVPGLKESGRGGVVRVGYGFVSVSDRFHAGT